MLIANHTIERRRIVLLTSMSLCVNECSVLQLQTACVSVCSYVYSNGECKMNAKRGEMEWNEEREYKKE